MGTTVPLLAARVKRSFRSVPGPERITRLEPWEDSESGAITAMLQGKHWSELTPELVQGQPDAIAFLSAEAFRYFLPGYLLIALEDATDLDVALIGLLNALAGPTNQEERFRMLKEDQLLVVMDVLEAITPEESDPLYWYFVRAKEGVLDHLTRPSAGQ